MNALALTEQEEVLKTRAGIRLMKQDVLGIKTDITEIKTALLGSQLTQDGGLVRRMVETEINVEKLAARMTEIEKWQALQNEEEARKKERIKKWNRVWWLAVAAAITTSITLLINHLVKIK